MLFLLLATAALAQDATTAGDIAGGVGGVAGGSALVAIVLQRYFKSEDKDDARLQRIEADVHALTVSFAKLSTELRVGRELAARQGRPTLATEPPPRRD